MAWSLAWSVTAVTAAVEARALKAVLYKCMFNDVKQLICYLFRLKFNWPPAAVICMSSAFSIILSNERAVFCLLQAKIITTVVLSLAQLHSARPSSTARAASDSTESR